MTAELNALAESVGVLTQYHDYKGVLRQAAPEAIVQVLQTLGVEISGPDDAIAARARHHRKSWSELVPPCAVVWDQGPVTLDLRVPASVDGPYVVELHLASGETRRIEGRLGELGPREHAKVDGKGYVLRPVSVPVGEHGYHRAEVQADGRRGTCAVIAAPLSAYRTPRRKRWGVFTPLYAVHREGGSGAGDLGDLERLGAWVSERGGSLVGTLPLLASFLSEPYEYSPYGPVSRMFWNELYLDLATAPGLSRAPAAQALLAGAEFAREADALRKTPLVEYRRQMALKRRVLEALAAAAWSNDGLRAEIEAYMAGKERADDYARFRAVTESHGKVWRDWPQRQRDCDISADDYDDSIRRYHLYVQYAMETQLAHLKQHTGAALYLDLPVGVHRFGYDTWRDRTAFAMDASAGAPPDPLFSEGQNWGGAPLHPWGLRQTGYRYFIDSVRAHFQRAGILRVDHAMGLHRMYWVPEGVSAKDGVYVHYNAGELYAILSLESHRHQCEVTGEDLGTVPDYVRPSMERHGLSRLYVGQFSLPEWDGAPILAPPARSVASLNTHDTPTWAGFWHGDDIDIRKDMGLIDDDETAAEHAGRRQACQRVASYLCREKFLTEAEADDAEAVMRAFTAFLAASEAEIVILTLEDLWLESRPQNVPGTGPDDRPNWRRKMAHSLDDILAREQASALLTLVEERRRKES
ncbi:4-alpha-glucanotransferase [Haliangium sp.]|uniref:4-alpha-glucanotransferase n=1 Tax=Haliangium sp. TaxID=2663208 RepID=UPI003D1352D4